MRKKFWDWLEKLAADRPVWLAFMVFLGTSAIVVPISIPFWVASASGFSMNIMSEAYGTLFDLLIIGWLLLWLNNLADRRQRKMRYREEIEDALGWRSPVASHRIVSNVRRLNRSGVTKDIELPEAYLKGASLENVRLNDSNLWGANLDEAALRQAQLSGSILAGAHFENADLESARFEGADLRGAKMGKADMERAHFEDADLRGADLEEADLQYATLDGIGLERAALSGTNLRGASLIEADLERATVHDANLTGAQLEGARLDGADFTDAQLREADLRGTSMKGTSFRNADLAGVQFSDEDLDAFGEAATLHGATLDHVFRERLEAAHPHLFEAPEKEGPAVGSRNAGGAASPSTGDTGTEGSVPSLSPSRSGPGGNGRRAAPDEEEAVHEVE